MRGMNPKLRYPLGFASGGWGLGFGAMTVTFRNCPNTAPLALWMEAGGWTPLFKRKLNRADYESYGSDSQPEPSFGIAEESDDVEELPW